MSLVVVRSQFPEGQKDPPHPHFRPHHTASFAVTLLCDQKEQIPSVRTPGPSLTQAG